jgi:alpha-glucosidase
MEVKCDEKGFCLNLGGRVLLESTPENPMIFAGHGRETVDMYRGNFKIEDYVTEREPLPVQARQEADGTVSLDFAGRIRGSLRVNGDLCEISLERLDPSINRFWFRVRADRDEHVYGCGEQMSYFDLRGRHFPLWTSEPGVGRDKTTYVTWRSDVENKAGGDYYNTNYPEATYVSSRKYYLNVDSTAYADFDFRNSDFHELQIWEVPAKIRIEAAPTMKEVVERETAAFGRQPELPDWAYSGLVLGVQGGSGRSFKIAEDLVRKGVKLAGVWCQDWCGKRVTSFGKRLQWDWHYHEEMYPDLPKDIERLHRKGIRFLSYINPYLVNDGVLYREGHEKGYFAKKPDGSDYLVDFGEFYCGVVDLTNPEAFTWFKEIIKKYTIGIGCDGWMADFGEYLPTDDIVLHNGASPMIEHNRWPVRWAACNYEALAETGNLGKIVYFMRAGGHGSQKYCDLLWAGDQSVDFSRHDGLCTVICAALSAGMTGNGLTHSDIGGYTSLFGNDRTKELFLRWAEMAVFTPFMRTHEGNRPDENFQFYDDEDSIRQMARLTDIFTMLSPYTKDCVRENHEKGIPVQRPLFLEYEDDPETYGLQFQYMLGSDVIVAPVIREGTKELSLYLPEGEWIHLWTGKCFGKGRNTVAVPMGYPAVFWKKGSSRADVFEAIRRKYGE